MDLSIIRDLGAFALLAYMLLTWGPGLVRAHQQLANAAREQTTVMAAQSAALKTQEALLVTLTRATIHLAKGIHADTARERRRHLDSALEALPPETEEAST